MDSYEEAHDAYLKEVIGGTDQAVLGRNGLVSLAFGPEEAAAFATTGGKPASQIDPEVLGLPPLTDAAGLTPVALIVHGRRNKEQLPAAVELLLLDHKGYKSSRFLENLGAAVGEGNTPQWIMPGNIVMSGPTMHITDKDRDTAGHKLTLLTAQPTYNHGEDASARIIRPRPTKAEQAAAQPEKPERLAWLESQSGPGFLRRYASKIGAAVMAGVAIATAPLHATTPDRAARIATAQEMVLPGGTTDANGVPQAEQFFNENTLSRVRNAFAAYYRGDKNALSAQTEALNFHADWMSPAALAAAEKAATYDELLAAFRTAMQDLPIELSLNREVTVDTFGATQYELEPNKDLAATKTVVMDILRLFNMLDKRQMLKELTPMQYDVVGSVKTIYAENGVDAAGYFAYTDGSTRPRTVLSAASSRPASDTAHEFTHYLVYNGTLRAWDLQNLNPEPYAGMRDFSVKPTVVAGNQITSENYGESDKDEDIAVTGQNLLIDHPVITAEDSTFLEKESYVIDGLEAAFPGFTASFLERAKIQQPDTGQQTVQEVLWHLNREGRAIFDATTLFLIASLLYGWQRRRAIRRREEATYGVIPTERTGRVIFDALSNGLRRARP
jgi:hypothetical protein